MEPDFPNQNNFCGGNFQDWLEVMLTPKCNGKCSWCIERNGFRPEKTATWMDMVDAILRFERKHVLLLGGEPTLYKKLGQLVKTLSNCGINVYITTNGSMLTPRFVHENLEGLAGINISIHHYLLKKNLEVTGIDLSFLKLYGALKLLKGQGTKVRLNCNLIKGYIDNKEAVSKYINYFAKPLLYVDNIRFAELKGTDGEFVDAAKLYDHKWGLNDDPFNLGCNIDTKLYGMPVNFRLMCGLQTKHRPKPNNPVQLDKVVLYYDGLFYAGWQIAEEDLKLMKSKKKTKALTIKQILKAVQDGKMSLVAAEKMIAKKKTKVIEKVEIIERGDAGGGCRY